MLGAPGLQVVPVDDDRTLLTRGRRELLLSGPEGRTVLDAVVPLLDGRRGYDAVVELAAGAAPVEEVRRVLDELLRRGLVVDLDDHDDVGPIDLVGQFFESFGLPGRSGSPLGTASVVVVGENLISRALCRSLTESGVGSLLLVRDDQLDDELMASSWVKEGALGVMAASGTLTRPADIEVTGTLDDDVLAAADLLVASCDLGPDPALLDLGRRALRYGVRYLPTWVDDLVGFVGPLVQPRETACLRCYWLRVDSNDPHRDVHRALRGVHRPFGEVGASTGLLPPVAAVVGEVAAMEAVKALTGFAPADTAGRSIEVNLVSAGLHSRRVLKVPRCPGCSDLAERALRVRTSGPQVPLVDR